MTSSTQACNIQVVDALYTIGERAERDQGNKEVVSEPSGEFPHHHCPPSPDSVVHVVVDKARTPATPDISEPSNEYTRRRRLKTLLHLAWKERQCLHDHGNKETPIPRDEELQDVSSSCVAQMNENEEVVITGIQVTDIMFGLRGIPAGFYARVLHSGLEWRTKSKRLSINNDDIEWDGLIPLPSDLAATVCLEIYASFEFEPMLGDGEQLRRLTVTVEKILHFNARRLPFAFFPRDGEVISPCSSLLVTVKRRKRERSDPSKSGTLDPHCPTTGSLAEVENATNGGHAALSRYRKHRDKQDLESSVLRFEHALNICPLDHVSRAACQSNMAMAKFIQCQVEDADLSLDVPLSLYQQALSARPLGHPDRPSTLIKLAAVRSARFEEWQDEGDSAAAVAFLSEATELCSADSHERQAAISLLQLHARREIGRVREGRRRFVEWDTTSGMIDEDLWILSAQLRHNFERFGNSDDLEQAILISEACVRSTSVRDHQHTEGLMNHAVALSYRFHRLGELSDLEKAISSYKDAVDLTLNGHPNKPGYLSNLGTALEDRFERLGELCDLGQAIASHRDAVDLTSDSDPSKAGRLSTLGSCFRTRFKRLAELSDLEKAISSHRDAVDLTPDGHPNKAGRLNNLANSFRTRFEHYGRLSDLEQAISAHEDSLHLTPDSHPRKPGCLTNLGNALHTRFRRLGDLSDLEQAISKHKDAVALTPDGRPDKPGFLNNLGISLMDCFEHLGKPSDLEEATLKHREAVNLTPDCHYHKAGYLNNLGIALVNSSEYLNQLDELEEAILRHKDAVDLAPAGHPDKPGFLHDLGNSLLTRFGHVGELSDLEQAISRHRVAVDLTPDHHPDKPPRLNSLGNSLFTRFRHLGELSDLEQAMSRYGDAIALTPDGQPNKPGYMNNLGSCLLAGFTRSGELSDLEQAILSHRNAVDLTPNDHPCKPVHLSNLGIALANRFERLMELSDLEQAIASHSDAVDLTPDGHAHKPGYLSNLGNSFRLRFQHLKEPSDLEQAILKCKVAIDITPDGHPEKPGLLNNLGDTFSVRFDSLQELGDLEKAIALYSRAACASVGSTASRFHASQKWVSCARTSAHESLLHAYSVAISLLPELAWIGLPLSSRYRELLQGADLVREAAATALDLGLPETAVEWLEQGRSIIWGEFFQLRSSYNELSSSHPDYASRLQQLSAALELASFTHERSLSYPLRQTQIADHRATESLEGEAGRHRMLAIERDKLLQEIRRKPGFERFLLHKEFSQLRGAAHSGPVVILNAAQSRCDALIIHADVENAIHVPLPSFTLKRSEGLQNALKALLGHIRAPPPEEREGDRAHRRRVNWEFVLSALWNGVVHPVLDSLDGISGTATGELSRIFWCPAGPFSFLPIHAAGIYDAQSLGTGNKVFDFVISSYTPTLSILLPSPQGKNITASRGDLRLLTVRQPLSDCLPRLPGVDTELKYIKAIIQGSPSGRTTLLESSVGTVDEVLTLMKEADWVHFACHGIQDPSNPTESGLCLANRSRLKLSDIIGLSRPPGGLAFLSACQTAMGDEGLPDEVIHVAAGMLFAGYGGVIGTMWSIRDRVAPQVAKDVYKQLFHDSGSADYRKAARALHNAVGRLRDSHASFDEWLPFIYVGL